jgi:hypothetical protein
MPYMFLIYLDENSLEEQRSACYRESAAYALELHTSVKRNLNSWGHTHDGTADKRHL